MSTPNHCTFLELPLRPKPREEGMTSLFDYFLPLAEVSQMLEVAAPAIDWAKLIHIGLTPALPEGWLRKKLELYRSFGIRTYPGGVPYQMALVQNQLEPYFDWLVELGFDGVEIADDAMETVMPRELRARAIRMAVERGLEVHTELGKKAPEAPLDLDEAYESIRHDLDLGVSHCVIERSELEPYLEGNRKVEHLLDFVERIGLKNLLFEPGPFGWPRVHRWCFQQFGKQVNLGNITKDEILYVEWSRIGLSRFVDFDYFSTFDSNGSTSPGRDGDA